MIITCEGCERRFQVDDARIPARGARVRCKRCHHRFHVMPGDAAAAQHAEAEGEQTLSGATAPPGADELRFVTEPPTGAPAEPSAERSAAPAHDAPVGEEGNGEGPWEFGDSSLSFDEANVEPAPARPEASAPAEPAAEPAAAERDFETTSQAFVDAIPDEPEAAPPADETASAGETQPARGTGSASETQPAGETASADEAEPAGETGSARSPLLPPSEREEESTLRPVAPVAGAESTIFEMTDDASEGEPLELESTQADEPGSEAPEAPAPPSPASSSPAAAHGEPSSAAEIDGEGLEDYAAAGDAADEVFDGFDFGEEDDSDPDWPEASGEGLPPAAVAQTPPVAARRGWPWWEHAGWALPMVILVAVLHGSVAIEPRSASVPAGEIALGALTAENVRGRFIDNARSGTLFVVSGELSHRSGPAAPAAGPLRVVLLDAQGRTLSDGAMLGPALPETALREMPGSALAGRQEDAAVALSDQARVPGARVAFDAVLGGIPERAVRFRIEAARGSAAAPRAGEPAPVVEPSTPG